MHLNFKFIYALFVIPVVLASAGQSCKTEEEGFNGYGICTSTTDCMPAKCGGKKRCINENFSVIPEGKCPDGDGICCIKTVYKLDNEKLPTPGRCLNKANCDSKKNKQVETKECPGKDAVLCIPKDTFTIKKTTILPKKAFDINEAIKKLRDMGIRRL